MTQGILHLGMGGGRLVYHWYTAVLLDTFIATPFFLRICPGRLLGENTVWIAVARILATFELSKPIDENGKPVDPDLTWVSALIW